MNRQCDASEQRQKVIIADRNEQKYEQTVRERYTGEQS
jgi:hypothetical protein